MPTNLRHTRLGGRVGSIYAATGATPAGGGALNYPTRWGLVSAWKLEEASGTRADSHGANPLTDNNTVTSGTGQLGTAAQFTAANFEYLTAADSASLSVGDIDFWLGLWVKPATTATMIVAEHGKTTQLETADHAFQLALTAAVTQFIVGNGAGQFGFANGAALTTNVWSFVLCWHDAVSNTVNIRINHGTAVTTSYTFGSFNATSGLVIGAAGPSASPATYTDGLIDAVAFGKSPPLGIAALADEISERLYGSGSGLEYPFS